MNADVAIYVQDPGVVAFADGLPAALANLGLTSVVNPAGNADYLAVVVGTGEDDKWPEILKAARNKKQLTIGLVDSGTSAPYRSIGLEWAGSIAVPDEHTKRRYESLLCGWGKRIRACGHPGHDALYAKIRGVDFGIKPRPTILFCAELSTSRDPLLDKSGRTEDAIDRFLCAVETLPDRPRLVLRPHPKMRREMLAEFIGKFDEVSEGGPAADAILAADVVIGLTTAALDEALILGRPALTIATPSERPALAGWRHGLVPAAWSPNEIASALLRMEDPDPAAVEAAFPRGGARKVAELIHDAIMAQMPTLDDGTVRLEPFADRHATERYVSWLNDPEIVRFSEQRHRAHTLESCKNYRESLNPPHKLWAIIAPPYGHVGNVSATVDKWNRVADLAILVGRRGEGIGTRAWRLALDWLLGQGGMRKVTAGTMAENEMMMGVIRNSGMSVEGRQSGRFLLEGVPVDGILAARETTA